jgi:hypothetical protein
LRRTFGDGGRARWVPQDAERGTLEARATVFGLRFETVTEDAGDLASFPNPVRNTRNMFS